MNKLLIVAILGAAILSQIACDRNNVPPAETIESPNGCISVKTDLTSISYNPTDYDVNAASVKPKGFPNMEVPTDNPMTVQGIELGRYLFYDKRLSANNTISCGSCHKIDKAFTDGTAQSIGYTGQHTRRGSMTLINVGYESNPNREHNFMWDGKFSTLEQQHLAPIEHPIEMGSNWEDVECFLRNDTMYQRMFRQAFGVQHTHSIVKDLAAKAIGQFMRTLNSANSKYDRVKVFPYSQVEEFTPSEQNGLDIFFNGTPGAILNPNLPDGECGHCHNSHLFTSTNFFNNGLQAAATLNDFADTGLGEYTGIPADNGKFKAPSLRNIELTAPYMHDGRFITLEEVINHYKTAHTVYSPNLDVNLAAPNQISPAGTVRNLSPTDIQDLANFLRTLTDDSYFNKDSWKDPF